MPVTCRCSPLFHMESLGVLSPVCTKLMSAKSVAGRCPQSDTSVLVLHDMEMSLALVASDPSLSYVAAFGYAGRRKDWEVLNR